MVNSNTALDEQRNKAMDALLAMPLRTRRKVKQ
jgi:hypothetical protein